MWNSRERFNFVKCIVLGGVGLVLIFLPQFIKSDYYIHLLIVGMLTSIVVLGFVAQLRVRLLSFCVATVWGIGAYISALLSTMYGIDFWLCLPLAGVGTAVIAFVLGLIIVRTGWVTFLMITIVMAEIFVEGVGHTDVLGGWDGLTGIPRPAIGSFVFFSKVPYYYLSLGLLVLSVLIFYAFYTSSIGKAWTAIGQSADLAASVGISIFKYRLGVYVVSAFTTGLSGSLFAHYMCFLVPQNFEIMRSLYMSIYAVVGGLGFPIAGPITGSVIMNILPETLRITDKYEPILFGMVIILCAIFFRNGIVGLLPKRITRRL